MGQMKQKYLTIPVSDLRYFEFSCPSCKMAFVYDVDGSRSFPEACPACGQDYYNKLPKSFAAYKDFYRLFGKLEQMNPRFRVEEAPASGLSPNPAPGLDKQG